MTELILQGPQPFDLMLQQPSTAVAEGGNVNATLAVFALGFPQNAAQIRLLLTADQASQIAEQLQRAVTNARHHARQD